LKELIIGTDLYETSDDNVLTGFNFAKSLDLIPTLYHIDSISPQIEMIFHASSIHTEYIMDKVWKKEIEKTVLERVNKQLGRLKLNKEEFNFENFEGSISEGIEHLRNHKNLEISSIGASHHGSLHRLFFNSFAEKMFFHLRKDTLIVKEKNQSFKNITYLVTHEEHEERHVELVSKIAQSFKSNVFLEYIVPIESLDKKFDKVTNAVLTQKSNQSYGGAEAFLKGIQEKISRAGVSVQYSLKLILNEKPGQTLKKVIAENNSDLVVIKPAHYMFEYPSVGSTCLDLLRSCHTNFYLLA